jgi:hypothetical protein
VPLFAGLAAVAPDSPPLPWREDVGTMYASWTDPTGVVWPLSDTDPGRGYFTTSGPAGWGAQPWEIVTDPMSRGWESVRHIRAQPARLTWPIHIWGDTHQQFVERYRALRRAILMTVHRGIPATLTVQRPDGSARFVECFYEDGWTGESGQNWLSASPILTLYCPDGAWKGVERTVERRTFGDPVSFFEPFGTLSGSQVLGETVVNNPGELPAWPEWVITGPCTSITATNNSTGQAFTLTYTLSAGQTIRITTERPTVRGPAGENLTGSLNWPTAYLWGLLPDDNDIEFAAAGGGTSTAIELSFHARYEGA